LCKVPIFDATHIGKALSYKPSIGFAQQIPTGIAALTATTCLEQGICILTAAAAMKNNNILMRTADLSLAFISWLLYLEQPLSDV